MQIDARMEIVLAPGEDQPTRRAAEVLAGDIAAITRALPSVREGEPPTAACLFIASASNEAARPVLRRLRVSTAGVAGRWESYLFAERSGIAVICGADPQATLRAVYAFGRDVVGVDPFGRWNGWMPEPRSRLDLSAFDRTVGSPAFRFRGWFLNHPRLIEWNLGAPPQADRAKKFRGLHGQSDLYGSYCSALASLISETALRADQNYLIPLSYLNIFDEEERKVADAVAASGLYLSFHHQEPLGANLAYWPAFWRKRRRKIPPMAFLRDPRSFGVWWQAHAEAWSRYERVLWVIGHRGPGDRPFWERDRTCPSTPAARGRVITRAMSAQVRAIKKACGPGRRPAWMATLWQEGSPLHRAGHLKFPAGTIVMMADHGARQTMREDFREVKRRPGRLHGVYYHVCYGPGGPLSTQGNSPDRMWHALRQVLAAGDTAAALLNVGSIRPYYLGLSCWSRLTTSPRGFAPEHFLQDWCRQRFGPRHAGTVAELFNQYFHGCIAPWTVGYDGTRGFWDGVMACEIMDIARLIDSGRPAAAFHRTINSTLPDVWSFLFFQRNKSAAVLDLWDGLVVRARRLAPRLPSRARPLFNDNLLGQAELMRGLAHALHAMGQAGLGVLAGDNGGAAREVARAAHRLEAALDAAGRLGNYGLFRGWHRRDKLTCAEPALLVMLKRRFLGTASPAERRLLKRRLGPGRG